jgi:hypothetical protein
MGRAAHFKQADVTRALKGVVAAGVQPSSCRIAPSGEIVVLLGHAISGPRNSFDELIGKAE